ncbi:biliverdin-producing heme oxygenase [Thiorhodococcus mannitoliphagus]|uniref:Biliverdin-producing heme oxygenase n=1 Tax=Thiorhodococcus mannitoliphagus TaxID=329406 RepID=A0A6P1DVX2_9GAMM|nr:biliverdin-producing heme oxygenase [Thiorhodococcus mannitoliphagus]NEX20846.1 biliverdin-producing heme oxygenase [Thiorhodococcus mannitoliphagus]
MTETFAQSRSSRTDSGSLALRLRRETAEAHEAVERLPLMVALMSDAVTRDAYRRYLVVMAGIYAPVEEQLYGGLSEELVERLGVRPKMPALLRDLSEQGETWTPRPEVARWHEPLEPLAPSDESALVGGIYVLEGATLGGRTIARHLARVLGDAFGAGSFLDFHGRKTSSVWKHFSQELTALAEAGRLDADGVIHGALATFDQVHRNLAQWGELD